MYKLSNGNIIDNDRNSFDYSRQHSVISTIHANLEIKNYKRLLIRQKNPSLKFLNGFDGVNI